MKIVAKRKWIIILAGVIAVAVLASTYSPIEVVAANDLKAPAFPKVARASDTSLKLTWKKVSGASGYDVFRYDSKSGKYKRRASVKGAKTVKWTDRGLKAGRKYIYKIRSYVINGRQKQVSAFSYSVSAVPYKKNANKVNASSNLSGFSTMEIGINQKLPVDVTAVPSKYGTSKNKKIIDPKIRLLPNSATCIKQSGTDIIGQNVGSTNIYAIAHNGNVKKIKVTVVDYAKPTEWMNLGKIGVTANVIRTQENDLTDIISYFGKHNEKSGDISLDDKGNLIVENNIDISGIKETLTRFFTECPLHIYFINVMPDRILIDLRDEYGVYHIVFNIQDNISEEKYSYIYEPGIKIAEHWYVSAHYYI